MHSDKKVNQTSLSEPGDLKPKCTVGVRVQTKARTDARAREERSEMTGHEARKDVKEKEEKKKCVKGKRMKRETK